MSGLTLEPGRTDAADTTAGAEPSVPTDASPGPDPGRRRSRRRTGIIVGAALVIGAGGWLALGPRAGGGATTGSTDTTTTATTTAAVTRKDLVEQTTVDGTLGYGDATDVFAGQGTVTATVPVGTEVTQGETVVEIDGRKIPLFVGTVPLWRELSSGVGDGADIQMLEQNLEAMGYGNDLVFTVDGHWDEATRIAVQRWQKALGADQTGKVRPGDVVVHDGPARISKVSVGVGQPAGPQAAILQVTGTDRSVQAKVKASQQGLVHVGDAVGVTLPDGTAVGGHITKVGNVATTDSSADANGNGNDNGTSSATLTVDIALDEGAQLGTLDQAPVSVKLTTSAAKGVLAVPINALLALREGGYGVEVVRSGGKVLVGVQPGSFANGWVQVDGQLYEGDTVVVPR